MCIRDSTRTVGGDLHGATRHLGRVGGVARHLINAGRNFTDSAGRGVDFLRLMLSGVGQMHGGRLRFLRAGRHLHRGVINRGHQGTQLFDGEVNGVCDRAGHIFGHGRLHGEIAFRQRCLLYTSRCV